MFVACNKQPHWAVFLLILKVWLLGSAVSPRPQLCYSWASVRVDVFGQTDHDVSPQDSLFGAQSLWVTCGHGPGVIGNCFTPGSDREKFQSLSVYPWDDGNLVRCLLVCLECHLILVCCILNNWSKMMCFWLQIVYLIYCIKFSFGKVPLQWHESS